MKSLLLKKRLKLILALSAFEIHILKKNEKRIQRILKPFIKKDIIQAYKIKTPTRQNTVTLIRSPHIHKTSREQFFKKSYKVTFICNFSFWKVLHLLVFLFKRTHWKGVALDLHWSFFDSLPPMNLKVLEKNLKNGIENRD